MNKQELTNYVYDFWKNHRGIKKINGTYDYLYNEISNNLETLKGVERELDMIRLEFELGYEENSLEYNNLCDLWDNLNYYKTNLQKEN
jgi:hypothetical protein